MAQLQEEGAAQKVLHVPLFLMSAVAVISASPVAPHLQKLRPLNRSYHRCDVRWVAHSFSRFGCRLRTTFMPRRMMNVHLLSSASDDLSPLLLFSFSCNLLSFQLVERVVRGWLSQGV